MKIRHRIAYSKETVSKPFIDFLVEKKAEFKKTSSDIGVAYIYEENDYLDELDRFYQTERTTPIIDVVYSDSEYSQAEWLSIRPQFRFEYPQPEDEFAYKHYTYDDKNYCEKCGCGLTQQASFRVKKEPKWGTRHFLMLNWVQNELFTSSYAKDCINSNEVIGLKWFEVINHRKDVAFEDFHQIYVENELKAGMINLQQSVQEFLNCKVCGSEKYIYSGRGLTFRKEVFENLNVDIIKTHESFGAGWICSKKNIISKRFYQMIKSYGLDKDVVFEPISLA